MGTRGTLLSAVRNHEPKQEEGVTATYARDRLIGEHQRALATWAGFLEASIRGGDDAKVVPFTGGGS